MRKQCPKPRTGSRQGDEGSQEPLFPCAHGSQGGALPQVAGTRLRRAVMGGLRAARLLRQVPRPAGGRAVGACCRAGSAILS